jgi:hypothetical protein
MICHKNKTIFIHIPKTAGTSVESMFGFVKLFKNSRKFEEKVPGKHLFLSQIYEDKPFLLHKYFIWTIVRNPWEREYSYYNMAKNQLRYRHMDFKQFLKEVVLLGRKNNTQVFADQLKFITLDDDIAVNKIIRYENLESGWEEVCRQIKKPYEKLNHVRKAKPKLTIKEAYDQECIDIVADLRKDDIEFLGYDFNF